MDKPKQPFRINVTLSADAYADLKHRAEAADLDMSQFVRNALQVYNFLQREINAGNQIFIGRDRRIEKELIVP